jgi:hypothetical protein
LAQGPEPASPAPKGAPAEGLSLNTPVGTAFTYQGRLLLDGTPVDGTLDFYFTLWDASSDGNLVAEQAATGVEVSDGHFSVPLDFGSDAFTGDARYLGIDVEGTSLEPRVALTAAPYAHSLRPGAVVGGNGSYVLSVTNSGTGDGIRAFSSATEYNWAALYGVNDSSGSGVYGSSSSGTGVYGSSGSGIGVSGTATGISGVGVYGEATSLSTLLEDDSYGGYFVANGLGDRGVYGESKGSQWNSDGCGGYFKTAGGVGAGVYGEATNSEGVNYGVHGVTRSDEGCGVRGEDAYGTGGDGVCGRATTSSGTGVHGTAPTTGTVGIATGSGMTYGVYGEATASILGCGVYGEGGYFGVRGWSPGYDGVGVYGSVDSDEGEGVYGGAHSSTSGTAGHPYGVHGYSKSGHGVYGETSGDWGNRSGVYGKAINDHAAGVTGWNTGGGVGVYAYSERGNIIEARSPGGDREFYVSNDGEVYADGSFHGGGADFAEMLAGADDLEPGDVLIIDPDGQLARSTEAYASTVVGVYSTKPAFVGGSDEEMENPGKVPLAIVGIAPVKASAENGPIAPGDLLVASAKPGHAMKAGPNPSIGTVIGKALEGLGSGTGVIQMLVMLQ